MLENKDQADVINIFQWKEQHRPQEAVGFCDNLSYNQSVEKLADRIYDQYHQSIAVEREIDEDEANINEHIIDMMRHQYDVSTNDIHHCVEVAFNTRLSQKSKLASG